MNGKDNKKNFNPRNHFFSLILNLPIDSSPLFSNKNSVSMKNFFKLSFGYEFDPTMIVGMYHDFFHVLETKFQSKEVKMML